jgi:hypothetical protein
MEVKNYWHYLAGALLILVLLVKGTTGCLIISAICVVLIFQKSIDWVRGGIGFIVTGFLFFVASQTIWLTMLSDIWLAPILSHVGEYDMIAHIGVTVIATTIAMSIYIPIVGIGTIYSAIWIKNHIHEKESKLLILSFFISLCVVWGQGESFAYQYFIFVLPAVAGLVLYERDTPKEKKGKLKLKRENIITTSIVILFVMWVLLYMPFVSFYGGQEKTMNDFFWQQSNDINNKFNFINETNILFLDTGSGPYYFHDVNSSCRYPAPLILQRANPNRLIVSNQTQYWDEYNCVINYMNGENTYIIADGPIGPEDSWFGSDTTEKQEIIKVLKNKFTNVHSGGWEIYKRVD